MAKEFLLGASTLDSSFQLSQREPIKHVLYGSKPAIAHTIHVLHNQGYAEAGAWSRLQPTQTPGEFEYLAPLPAVDLRQRFNQC